MTKTDERSWTVVEIEVTAAQEDLASWLLIHHLGANGCQVEAANGDRLCLQASFETSVVPADDPAKVLAALDEYGLSDAAASLKVRLQGQEDWLAEWKKGFKPLPVGQKFLISPPWCKEECDQLASERKVIWIEPGLAFGTGYHATTQYCLDALERVKRGKRILDVGTGSGILAIGAALLAEEGSEILAVEIDPEACRVARENFAINKVEHVKLVEGSIDELNPQARYDTILSNLTCEDNCALLSKYQEILADGGHLIMSGILKDKLPRLEAALKQTALVQVESRSNETWSCVIAKK